MLGTASTVRNWLLLEHPGPWGEEALRDARMPAGLGGWLRGLQREHRVRAVLIRRPGRDRDQRTTCFAIRSGPGEAWIERADLSRPEEVGQIDVAALGRGERPGLSAHHTPLFTVCTHGRHDRCCAERGRPLAGTLAGSYPDETWECSHIGGDRFAGNVVAFPHGLYFGRVTPNRAAHLARTYLEGRIDLALLRGRSCYPMDVQAAEFAVRAELGLDRIEDVVPQSLTRHGRDVRVALLAAGERYVAHVRQSEGERARLTCRAAGERVPPAFRVLSIEPA